MSSEEFIDPGHIVETLKRSAAALREARVPFVVGGGIAVWARGGPRTENDIDVMVLPEDARRAQHALVEVGMRAEDPPEEWLLKAWDDEVLVDIIFEPQGLEMTPERIERAEMVPVMAITLPVMDLEDVLVSKLMALAEHELDYSALVEIARSVREQVDWQDVRTRTEASPFARAFFTIIEGLGLVEPPVAAPEGQPADATRPRIRLAR